MIPPAIVSRERAFFGGAKFTAEAVDLDADSGEPGSINSLP